MQGESWIVIYVFVQKKSFFKNASTSFLFRHKLMIMMPDKICCRGPSPQIVAPNAEILETTFGFAQNSLRSSSFLLTFYVFLLCLFDIRQ